jgi:hypothetical protein
MGFVVVVALFTPRSTGVPALSVQFVRYGFYDGYGSNCAFLIVSNSGTGDLICRGVGASSEQQLIRLWTGKEWVDSDRVWLSPGSDYFKLAPGSFRAVPIVVLTNLDWSICFHYMPKPPFWRRVREVEYQEHWSDRIRRKI